MWITWPFSLDLAILWQTATDPPSVVGVRKDNVLYYYFASFKLTIILQQSRNENCQLAYPLCLIQLRIPLWFYLWRISIELNTIFTRAHFFWRNNYTIIVFTCMKTDRKSKFAVQTLWTFLPFTGLHTLSCNLLGLCKISGLDYIYLSAETVKITCHYKLELHPCLSFEWRTRHFFEDK